MSEQQGQGALSSELAALGGGRDLRGQDTQRRDAVISGGGAELAAVWGSRPVDMTRVRRVPMAELVEWVVEFAREALVYRDPLADPVHGRLSTAPRLKAGDVETAFSAFLAARKGLDDVGLGPQKQRDLVVDVLRSAGVRYVVSGRYFQGLTWTKEEWQWASTSGVLEEDAGQSFGADSEG